MKLHREIGVTQKTAWFMLQRIRKAFDDDDEPPFSGLRRNMPESNRESLAGRGTVGKDAVVGVKGRATGRIAVQPLKFCFGVL